MRALLLTVLGGMLAQGCRAPDAASAHRQLVLRPGDPLLLAVAGAVRETHAAAARELPVELLAALTGEVAPEADASPADAGAAPPIPAGGVAAASLIAALPRLEGLLEGLLGDMLDAPVDGPTPRFDLDMADLRVVDRESKRRLHQRAVAAPWLTPLQGWALAYLVVHVGPDHWDDLQPDDPDVLRFAELAGTYARSPDPVQRARALTALRLLERSLFVELELSAEQVAAHDAAYDASVSPVTGLARAGPFHRSLHIRLDNANWSLRGLVHTWSHELTHHLYWDRLGVWRSLLRALGGADDFRASLEENVCEVMADLVVERLVAERLDLPDLPTGEASGAWLDLALLERVPRLTSAERDRLHDLYSTSRVEVELGDMLLVANAAENDVRRVYRSLRSELTAVGRAWGPAALLELAADVRDRAALDALADAAEAGADLEAARALVE